MKRTLILAILPFVLSSCGTRQPLPTEITKEEASVLVSSYSDEATFPGYRVTGFANFANEHIVIKNEATGDLFADFINEFDETQEYYKSRYPKYNLGYYPESPEPGYQDRADAPIHYNGSKSYWTRCPLRINGSNFLTTYTPTGSTEAEDDPYNAYNVISGNLIMAGSFTEGIIFSTNEETSSRGGANGLTMTIFESNARLSIFNFVKYEPRLDRTLSASQVGARIRAELVYDSDGWLVSEMVESLNYKGEVNMSTFHLESHYTWNHE